jgi:hypothetical protein
MKLCHGCIFYLMNFQTDFFKEGDTIIISKECDRCKSLVNK